MHPRLAKLLQRHVGLNLYRVLSRRLESAAPTPPPEGIRCALLDEAQALAHSRDPQLELAQASVHEAFARGDVCVGDGNHDVAAAGGFPPLRSWYPIEILHFSFRSRRQFVAKASRAYEAWSRSPGGRPTLHHKLAYDAVQPDSTDDLYGRFLVDDDALEQGLADGTLAIDTRLRDALQGLRVEEGGFALPEPGAAGLSFPKIGIADEAAKTRAEDALRTDADDVDAQAALARAEVRLEVAANA